MVLLVFHQQGTGILVAAGEGGVGGGPCMCLCTVYGSHRVHLFKNQKHYLFLYHQGFSQKLETTKRKKKKKVSFSCALQS